MLVAESINGSHPTSSTFCILQNFSGSPPESCEAPLLVIPTSQPTSEVRFQHMTVSIPMPTLPKAAHVKSHSYTLQSLTPKAYRRLLRPRVTAGFAFIPCRTVEGVSRNMPGHSNHCWVWAYIPGRDFSKERDISETPGYRMLQQDMMPKQLIVLQDCCSIVATTRLPYYSCSGSKFTLSKP